MDKIVTSILLKLFIYMSGTLPEDNTFFKQRQGIQPRNVIILFNSYQMYMFAFLNKTNQKPRCLFGSSLTMVPRRLQHCQAQLGTPYHPRSLQAGTVPSRILKLYL